MPIDFPSSPTTGQVYTYEGKSWVYNGTGWDSPRALSEIGAVQTFENAAARTAAIPTPTEGIVSYLNDVDLLQTNNGSAWVTTGNAGVNAYNFVQTLYFTSSGTFTKATYPWLRAIKVKVQGAGGGGGGTSNGTSSAGGGGAGGGYGEAFITDISGLDSSITVTRGAGGAGASNRLVAASDGGASSFGSLVVGEGGIRAGSAGSAGEQVSASGSLLQLAIASSGGGAGFFVGRSPGGTGGSSFLGGGARGSFARDGASRNNVGASGSLYGGGGGGATADSIEGADLAGGAGANGIVIVELYA
jgi:hypothetical protein